MPPPCLIVVFPLRSPHLSTCGLKVTRAGGPGEQEDDNQCMGRTSEGFGSVSLGNLAPLRQDGSCRLSPCILLCLWVGMSSCWENLGLGPEQEAGDQRGVTTLLPVSGRKVRGTSRTFDIAFFHNKKGGRGSGQDSAQEFGVCLQPVPISGTKREQVIKQSIPTSTS